jgi:hypothetical protein
MRPGSPWVHARHFAPMLTAPAFVAYAWLQRRRRLAAFRREIPGDAQRSNVALTASQPLHCRSQLNSACVSCPRFEPSTRQVTRCVAPERAPQLRPHASSRLPIPDLRDRDSHTQKLRVHDYRKKGNFARRDPWTHEPFRPASMYRLPLGCVEACFRDSMRACSRCVQTEHLPFGTVAEKTLPKPRRCK